MSNPEDNEMVIADPPLRNVGNFVANIKKKWSFKSKVSYESLSQNIQRIVDIDKEEHESLELSEARILVLENCSNIQKLLEVLNHKKFRDFLVHSSHCFVLIVFVSSTGNVQLKDFQKRFKIDDLLDRPLIIQLNFDDTKAEKGVKTVFFKNAGHGLEWINDEKIDKKEFLRRVESSEIVNFRLLLSYLNSRVADEFKGDFIARKVNLGKKIVKRLIDKAIHNDDSLSIRFLMLSHPEACDAIAIRNALTNGSLATLRALLGYPIIGDGKFIPEALNDELKLESKDSMMCIAAKSSKSDIVEFLIRLDFFNREPEHTLNVTESAMTAGNFANLCLLLENDFPFPADCSQLLNKAGNEGISETVSRLIEGRRRFHKAIKDGNETDVQKFIDDNPKTRIGYSEHNKSALAEALKEGLAVALKEGPAMKSFKMYALLWYNRFEADDKEYEKLYAELTNETKQEITEACKAWYDRPADSHILFIFSKTRLGLVYEKHQQEKHFEKIKDFLDSLNQIDETASILKVIEHSHALSIVFDFDNKYVGKIDLTQSKNTKAMGLCYHTTGQIYIAANNSYPDVLSNLTHELTHYAMKIVFDNAAMPFRAESDLENTFRQIVHYCKSLGERNVSFIKNVFTEGYKVVGSENDQMVLYCCELIVRIPEMYAYHLGSKDSQSVEQKAEQQKLLDNDLERYESLKDFYFQNVDTDIKEFVKDPALFQRVRTVQQLNDRLGNIREFSEFKLYQNESEVIEISEGKRMELIISQIPKFTIANLIRSLKKTTARDEIIVLSSRDFRNESIIRIISAACLLSDQISITLIINYDDLEEIPDYSRQLLEHVKSLRQVYFVFEEGSAELIKKTDYPSYQIETRELKYKWDDLEDETKSVLLKIKVAFQDLEISLDEIVERNSEAARKLPLVELVKGSFKNIGKPIKKNAGYNSNYYIERSLHNFKVSFDIIDFESFLQQTEDEKLVLISDDAGMGKSTLLTHIAIELKQQFTNYWVVHVDLHDHVETFRKESFENVFDLVIKNESIELDFEKTLMTQMFNESKVILLIDGLDEIAPTYFESFSGILKQLTTSSIKQNWITMRPYIERQLKEKLGGEAWGIKPFNPESQIEFIVKYFKNKLTVNELAELTDVDMKLQRFAEKLLSRVSETIDEDSSSSDLTGIPLQARMLAEIFFDDIRKNLLAEMIDFNMPDHFDLFWLHQEFMTKKIEVVYSEYGQVVRNLKASREAKREDIWRDHEKLAVKYVLPEECFTEGISFAGEADKDLMKLDKRYFRVRMSNTDLQEFVIISIDLHEKLYFIHRTYAEYFVAIFISQIITAELFEISSVKAKEVIKLLACLGSATYQTTINFIECSLKKYQKELDNYGKEAQEKVQRKVSKAIETIKNFDFLQHYAQSEIFLTNFLLTCVSFCSKEKIEEVLWHRPNTLLWHASASGIKCTIQQVLELADNSRVDICILQKNEKEK